MCGRFFLSTSAAEIAGHFSLPAVPELAPRFNIAPGQPVPVVRQRRSAPGERVLELRRWGFVPSWAKDPRAGARPVNARSETAATRAPFRAAMARRRGLVPADGFYEWQHRGRSARPFAVRVRGGALFAMAALWERWEAPTRDADAGRAEEEAARAEGGARADAGKILDTCAILTTEANESIRVVHDRMPVIVAPEDYARWLDPGLQDPASLADLLRPCPPDWIELQPVGRRVNDTREDDAGLLAPEPELFPP